MEVGKSRIVAPNFGVIGSRVIMPRLNSFTFYRVNHYVIATHIDYPEFSYSIFRISNSRIPFHGTMIYDQITVMAIACSELNG